MLKDNPVSATAAVHAAMKDERTHKYVFSCLRAFLSGDYGAMPKEDAEANRRELERGTGRVIGRYDTFGELGGDIYIIGYFSDEDAGIDYNYTTILYCSEY